MGITNNKLIGLDTNIFIYYFQQNPEFGELSKSIFENLALNRTRAITSIVTLIELLSLPSLEKEMGTLKNLLLETPNLTICDLNQNIGVEAAEIRRRYKFRLPDAIQLATCLSLDADMFITNDQKLKSFKEIPVILLNQTVKF